MDPEQGGVSQAVRNIVKSLNDLEITNQVVSVDAEGQAKNWNDSFITHTMGTGGNPWSYSPLLLPWLKANLKNYDAVIVHGLWLYHGFAVLKAIKSLKGSKQPKLYVMPHGMLDPYFQKAEGRRLKAIRNYFYWKLIESKLVNSADALLFTCEQEKMLAATSFSPYKPKQTFVVSLGVLSPPVYEPAMLSEFIKLCPQVKDKPYFLFLSRIHPKKGVDLLLEAYHELFALGEADVPMLVVAGPGLDTEYGKEIASRVDNSGLLRSQVFFPGMLLGMAKWGAFYGCETFVLPSHQENFGIAVVEALACGKPVLISDQVNIFTEISTGRAGIIFADSAGGMREGFKTWMALSPSQKDAMQLNTKKVYTQNFGIVETGKKMAAALLA